MVKILKKKISLGIILLVAVAAIAYFAWPKNSVEPLAVVYRNSEYGFSVALPDDWRGYTVSMDRWTGDAINDQIGEVHYADGPVVSIHNPKWTRENPYQDIPVMVFTLAEWSDLQAEKFHIGAAPIGPSELGHNAKYVFALPARYNFAFPPGYEEVEGIMQSKPLKTF